MDILNEIMSFYKYFSFLAPYKYLIMLVMILLCILCIIMAVKSRHKNRGDD